MHFQIVFTNWAQFGKYDFSSKLKENQLLYTSNSFMADLGRVILTT